LEQPSLTRLHEEITGFVAALDATNHGEISLRILVQKAACLKSVEVIVDQLFWFAARRLESPFTRQVRVPHAADVSNPVRCLLAPTKIEPGSSSMDEHLFKHAEAAVVHSRGRRCCGIATDKVRLPGGSVQNTAIAYPDNVCFIACPQVHVLS